MANTYTINTTTLNSRILDKTLSFPPTSKYKLIITPVPGETIQAAQYTGEGMSLSYEGDTNSHTKWPSRFQWTMPGLGESDNTISGLKELPAFYKVVFEDSTNPNNDTNWDVNASPGNSVYAWVYFGKNETTTIGNLDATNITIDINYNPTLITQSEVINPINTATTNITSFNI